MTLALERDPGSAKMNQHAKHAGQRSHGHVTQVTAGSDCCCWRCSKRRASPTDVIVYCSTHNVHTTHQRQHRRGRRAHSVHTTPVHVQCSRSLAFHWRAPTLITYDNDVGTDKFDRRNRDLTHPSWGVSKQEYFYAQRLIL